MIMRLSLALALACGVALAQENHDGKVPWIKDPEAGLQKIKLEGKVGMLWFTADWWGPCKGLGAGAFSDDKLVMTTTRVVPILVDCSKQGQNADLMQKYKVEGFPTVVYVDPEGKMIKEMGSRDASAICKEIEGLAAKYPGKPTIWQNSRKAALDGAKKAKKPVAVYLVDPKADLAKLTTKLTKDLGDRKTKFLWVLETAKEETLKEYGVEAAPAVVVLDPSKEDPAKEPVAKIAVKDDDKAEVLNKALDEAAKSMKK